MLRKLQVTIMILLIPLTGLYIYAEQKNSTIWEVLFPGSPILDIGDVPLRVEIADTPEKRQLGLSGRDDMGGIDGLLFVFDEPGYHGIWMKNMKFSIDIIWINEELEVVEVTERVNPNTYPRIFEPPVPVKYIVETDNFFAETFGIQEGDKVRLPNKYFR